MIILLLSFDAVPNFPVDSSRNRLIITVAPEIDRNNQTAETNVGHDYHPAIGFPSENDCGFFEGEKKQELPVWGSKMSAEVYNKRYYKMNHDRMRRNVRWIFSSCVRIILAVVADDVPASYFPPICPPPRAVSPNIFAVTGKRSPSSSIEERWQLRHIRLLSQVFEIRTLHIQSTTDVADMCERLSRLFGQSQTSCVGQHMQEAYAFGYKDFVSKDVGRGGKKLEKKKRVSIHWIEFPVDRKDA